MKRFLFLFVFAFVGLFLTVGATPAHATHSLDCHVSTWDYPVPPNLHRDHYYIAIDYSGYGSNPLDPVQLSWTVDAVFTWKNSSFTTIGTTRKGSIAYGTAGGFLGSGTYGPIPLEYNSRAVAIAETKPTGTVYYTVRYEGESVASKAGNSTFEVSESVSATSGNRSLTP